MSDFEEEMDRLQDQVPDWVSRNLERLRRPRAVWVRVPAGIALTGGGVLSFLPVLGIWMLPVGVALLAHDVPVMRRPAARILRFTNGAIEKRKGRKRASKKTAPDGHGIQGEADPGRGGDQNDGDIRSKRRGLG
jgi:hypothetical protein